MSHLCRCHAPAEKRCVKCSAHLCRVHLRVAVYESHSRDDHFRNTRAPGWEPLTKRGLLGDQEVANSWPWDTYYPVEGNNEQLGVVRFGARQGRINVTVLGFDTVEAWKEKNP